MPPVIAPLWLLAAIQGTPPAVQHFDGSPPKSGTPLFTTRGAHVVRIFPVPFDCGVLKIWGALDLESEGKTHRIYALCARPDDLPLAGATCDASWYRGLVDDLTSDGRKAPFEANISAGLTCTPPAIS